MSDSKKIREWALANGIDVPARGALTNRVRAAYYADNPDDKPAGFVDPVPGPDDLDDLPPEDYGVIAPDGPDSDAEARTGPFPGQGPRTFRAVPDGPPEPLPDDGKPAHAGKQRRPRQPSAGASPRPGRVTAGIRADIQAKISFALMIPGSIWQARDPLCGSVFLGQVEPTAEAFTDIVCDSADLIAFFTGPGGTFMKALKVGAALMPVAQVVMAHHVYHTIEEVTDPQQPQYQDVAA